MSQDPWRVELARTAERDLRRLDPQIRRRVERGLRELAMLDPTSRTILVTRVLPRGRAYGR